MENSVCLISQSKELFWICSRKIAGNLKLQAETFESFKATLARFPLSKFFSVIADPDCLTQGQVEEIFSLCDERKNPCHLIIDVKSKNDIVFRGSDASYIFTDKEFPAYLSAHQLFSFTDGTLDIREGFPMPFGEPPSDKPYSHYLEKYAAVDEPVLLLGESGCGKGFSALKIHRLSSRKDCPFESRSLASFSPTLMETELFGSVKGAYTGAMDSKKSVFEIAGNGTLFLDEIGELSYENQAKLLEVLDSMEYCHVGGTKKHRVRCRLIFATDADLEKMVREHKFKKQLYWRLSKLIVKIPPLRVRKEEIRPLAEYFASHYGKKISPQVMPMLENYSWPGNIRQLMFCIQRAAILCEGDTIEKSDIIF